MFILLFIILIALLTYFSIRSKKFRGLLIAGIVFCVLGLFAAIFAGSYNKMVNKREKVAGAWAQVENVYQRRADLIPNLVNTVQGYADFEQETLQGVIEARSKATGINVNADDLSPEKVQQFQQAQQGLSSALSRLMVVVERYPDLKANQNFSKLQDQLEGTENRIAVERRRFTEVTQDYNAYIQNFPQVMLAGIYGFEKKGYFEADQGAEKAPEVSFD